MYKTAELVQDVGMAIFHKCCIPLILSIVVPYNPFLCAVFFTPQAENLFILLAGLVSVLQKQ